MRARASGHEVVGDRRQSGVGLGIPCEQHAEHVRVAEHRGHLVDVVMRQLGAEVALTGRAELAERVVDVLGCRRVHVDVDRAHHSPPARSYASPRVRGLRPPYRSVGPVPAIPRFGRACRARTPRTARRRATRRPPPRPRGRSRRGRGRRRPGSACRRRTDCARTALGVPRSRESSRCPTASVRPPVTRCPPAAHPSAAPAA